MTRATNEPEEPRGPMVQDAAVAYIVGPDPEIDVLPHHEVSKMSSKNQITLPAVMVRYLGLQAGDELDVWLERDHIVLEKRLHGEELLDRLGGSVSYPEWSTKEKIDAWVRTERDSWDREWDEKSS